MKKVICLILAFVIVLSVGAFAYNDVQGVNENAYLGLLSTLNIMSGYGDGSFHPYDPLTRAQLAKIAVNITNLNNAMASYAGTSPFPDVPFTHWAAGYISVVTRNSVLMGYPDGTFQPDRTVAFEEVATVLVRLLGYNDNDVQGIWPYNYLSKAEVLGVTDGVSGSRGQAAARLDVARMIYNMLLAKVKSGGSSGSSSQNTSSQSSSSGTSSQSSGDSSSPQSSSGSTSTVYTPTSSNSSRYIETMGYKYVQNVVLIATNNEDGNVDKGSVYTSSGTYLIDDLLAAEYIGHKGDIITDKNNKIIAFIPAAQKMEQYVANTAGINSLTYYDGNSVKSMPMRQETTVYNQMVKSKWSAQYSQISAGDTIKVFMDDKSNIQYILINKTGLAGPVTVMQDNWKTALGISGPFRVIKNGDPAAESDIKDYDAAYYSQTAGIVWVYDKKVTGIYESALPTRDQPTQVTVSGTTYTINSPEAAVKLGSGGNYTYGDTVTLIFGRDNKVVDVISPSEYASSSFGFLMSTGTKDVTDVQGNSRKQFYARLMLPDGTTQDIITGHDYADLRGNLVQYKYEGNTASLNVIRNSSSLEGVVDAQRGYIGRNKLSKNVNILDIVTNEQYHDGQCISVFLQRLDGVNLSSQDVKIYTTDSVGDIDFILLDHVTGDGYSYGMVEKVDNKEKSGSYTFIIGDTETNLNSSTKYLLYEGGAAQFQYVDGGIAHVIMMSKVNDNIVKADNTMLYTETAKYKLSDKVLVYKKKAYPGSGLAYLPVDLNTIVGQSDLNLDAFYDKPESKGGRIRVIVIN